MNPVIAINGSFLANRVTGVQRYAHEVIREFQRLGIGEFVILAPGAWAPAQYCGYFVLRDTWPVRRSMWLWEQLRVPALFRASGAVGLWSPCNGGPLSVKQQVVTLHDASLWDHPEWFRRGFGMWYRWLGPRLGHRVKALLTDSEFSRKRLSECLAVPLGKITAVHLGAGGERGTLVGDLGSELRERWGIPHSYVLTVGSVQPRKNLSRLFAAWELVRERVSGVSLVVAGGSDRVFASAEVDAIPAGVRLIGYVTDAELALLYANATALAYPSLYEGFGLPPLEAMSYGTPVVTSGSTSLPEVVDDAAIIVDPLDVKSIAAGLIRVLEDPALRVALRERGLAQARKFTWEACARRTATVLQDVLFERVGGRSRRV